MIIHKTKKIIAIFILSLFVSSLTLVKAQATQTATVRLNKVSAKADFDTYVDLNRLVGGVINSLLEVLGVIFLVLLIYGGFTWMQARGDDQAVNKSKEIMINASIGLIIILGAYLITYYIISSLVSRTLNRV